jgi:hypothetical protein
MLQSLVNRTRPTPFNGNLRVRPRRAASTSVPYDHPIVQRRAALETPGETNGAATAALGNEWRRRSDWRTLLPAAAAMYRVVDWRVSRRGRRISSPGGSGERTEKKEYRMNRPAVGTHVSFKSRRCLMGQQ